MTIENTYIANKSEIRMIQKNIKDNLMKNNINQNTLNKLLVVSEEIITNIIKFAYSEVTEGYSNKIIKVKIDIKDEILIQFIDYGCKFNLLEAESGPMEELRIGGLGIFFIKQYADNLEYQRIDNMNILNVYMER